MNRLLHKKKLHTDNSGMTIVEVLVGFVVLAIILASLSGIIVVSRNMYFRSIDTSTELNMIQTELYKTNVINSAEKAEGPIKFIPSEGMPESDTELSTGIDLYKIGEQELLGVEGSELSQVKYYFLKKEN